MSRNDFSYIKAAQQKKLQLHQSKDYQEPFSLMSSTIKKSNKKDQSNKQIGIGIGIKRMTSSQLINPIITHSVSPNHTKNHESSSVPKKYIFGKQIKSKSKGNHKYQHYPKNSNTSSNTSSMNHLPNSTPQSQNTINSTPAAKQNQNSSNSTNNYIINTLNVSTKNVINNSIDHSEPIDYTIKYRAIQKENGELKVRSKEQAKNIEALERKTKSLEKELLESLDLNKKLKKKYIEVKDNENQLLAMLYVIDQSGVPVDDIIDKYNRENRSARETNRSFDSAMYIPITLEHSAQPQPLTNIPKLNFSRINQSYQMNISQGEDNILNNSQIVFNNDKMKIVNDKGYFKNENKGNGNMKNKVKLQFKKK